MNFKNLRVRDKILISTIPILAVALIASGVIGYYWEKDNLLENYQNERKQVERHIVKSLNLIDTGYRILEKKIEEEMTVSSQTFLDEFEKSGADAKNIDLERISERLGNKYDLFIIDESTTVIKSTNERAANFNFAAFDRKLGEVITDIRIGKEVRHERIRTNVVSGFLSKFSYIPTNDHKYVLELEYSEGGLRDLLSDLEPMKVSKELVKDNGIVSSVRFFDVYGYEFTDSGDNYEPTKESLIITEKAMREKHFEINEKGKVKSYIFIDLSAEEYSMTDNSKIVEITYDRVPIQNRLRNLALSVTLAVIVTLLAISLFIMYISRRITSPITALAKAANEVAEGNLNFEAKKKSNDEIGELTDVFNTMVFQIKENFEKIEKQQKELRTYSRNLESLIDQKEKSLREERKLFKAALLSIGEALVTTDKNGKIAMMNTVAENLSGVYAEEAVGKDFDQIFTFMNDVTKQKWENPIAKIIDGKEAFEDDEPVILISKNGKEIPIEKTVSPIKDKEGKISGVVIVFRDFSEKKEKQKRIEYLSFHDQLTGLHNRRFLEEEIKRLDNSKITPLSVIMLDVNGLKLINDAFGHPQGDLALKKAAEAMKSQCTKDDIIARLGGDEFVIIMPGADLEKAKSIVENIYAQVKLQKNENFEISVSCGTATKENEGESLSTILKIAEDAMYRRKLSESRSMHHKTIDTIIKTLHGKSEREKKHSERVGSLCVELATALGLPNEDIHEFETIGLMHDIGKIAIDLLILDKPTELSAGERKEIERHPELGYQILRSINDFAKIAGFVLCHHERWDGKGYPRGLKGDEIPLEARIIGVVDAYDAITSDRAYREAMSEDEALKEIIENAGTQFDPIVAKVFVEKVLKARWPSPHISEN